MTCLDLVDDTNYINCRGWIWPVFAEDVVSIGKMLYTEEKINLLVASQRFTRNMTKMSLFVCANICLLFSFTSPLEITLPANA